MQRETRVKQAALDLQIIFNSILAMKLSKHISCTEINHFIADHRIGIKNMKVELPRKGKK